MPQSAHVASCADFYVPGLTPSSDLISDLKERLALLEQRNKHFEAEVNKQTVRLDDTRKALFAEREARSSLEHEFHRTLAKYRGMGVGMLMIGTTLGFMVSKAHELYAIFSSPK